MTVTRDGNELASQLSWRLDWDHGQAEVQALGAMLGPVTFRLDAHRQFQVMHLAPWADTLGSQQLPGMLRRLRGEWPCVPFGRTDAPADLPSRWHARIPEDEWAHGYGSHHAWTCLDADAQHVRLAIDYPPDAAVARVEREVRVVRDAAALDMKLVVHARKSLTVPVGLHHTFRLPQPAGRMRVALGAHDGIFSYPSGSAGALSHLQPDSRGERLESMPGADGTTMDLSHLPLARDGEELLQVRGVRAVGRTPPLSLHYLDEEAQLAMWWDTAELPDLMLWVSNRGRPEFPWQGRHLALGAEPMNGVFDLGRVASPPSDHALADRRGVQLQAGST